MHQQIGGEVLNEELAVMLDCLAHQGVQHGVSGTICRNTTEKGGE